MVTRRRAEAGAKEIQAEAVYTSARAGFWVGALHEIYESCSQTERPLFFNKERKNPNNYSQAENMW